MLNAVANRVIRLLQMMLTANNVNNTNPSYASDANTISNAKSIMQKRFLQFVKRLLHLNT